MRYTITKHVGEVMEEHDYEGTPEEIKDLLNAHDENECKCPYKVEIPEFNWPEYQVHQKQK